MDKWKCSRCGSCCSSILSITDYEFQQIKQYIKDNNIKLIHHSKEGDIDLLCPFLDTSKKNKKCNIYNIRPRVCRLYQCNIVKERKLPHIYKIRNLQTEVWNL